MAVLKLSCGSLNKIVSGETVEVVTEKRNENVESYLTTKENS